MTRICQVTSVHSRYDVRIFHKIAKSVAAGGFESYILVRDNLGDEKKDGVMFQSVDFVAKNRIDRILNSWKKLLKPALAIDADLYHIHDPELIKLGIMLKKHGKKVVFDSHEDYYLKIKDKHWIPRPFRKLFQYAYGKKEKKYFSKYDGLISVTPHIVDRLKTMNENTVMITNYPTPIHTERCDTERIICFAGGISKIYMHDKIIQAISSIDDVKYCLAGPVHNQEYIDYLRSLPGFEKVEFLGKLPYEEVAKLYSKSKLGVVTYNYSQALGGKLGTLGVLKLFEYIQCGIPMVATDFDLWKPIVEDNHIGICVNPNDVEQIRDAIIKLLDDDFNEMCRQNCAKIKDKYSWQSQEKILLEFYDKIIKA